MRIPKRNPSAPRSHRASGARLPLLLLLLSPPLALAGGCAAKKPAPAPPPAPSMVLSTDHFAGTPLTGPRAEAPAGNVAAASVPGVSLVVVAFAQVPRQSGDLQPVGARATLLTATLGERAVMPSPRLASDALIAEGDAAAELVAAARSGSLGAMGGGGATLSGALPPEVTARFAVSDPRGSTPAGRGIVVEVFAPTTTPPASPPPAQTQPAATNPANAPRIVRVALRVTDLADLPQPPTTQPAGAKDKSKSAARPATPVKPPPPQVMREESVLFDRPLDASGRARLALVVPFHFSGSASKALLLYVDVHPPAPGDAAHAEAVRRAVADATGTAAQVVARGNALPGALPPPDDVRAGAFAVLARAHDETSLRSALLYLADRTDSPAAADVALVADGPTLAALSQAITDAAAKRDPKLAAADPGWLVDRTTLGLLSERLSAEALSPELTSSLVRRAGDLARRPDSLAELLKAATGTKDLDNRIEAENHISLEDSSPAARVRAYDYLASRGKAPAGYDPLGPPRDRRAALDKALAPPESPAAPAPATQPAAVPAAAQVR